MAVCLKHKWRVVILPLAIGYSKWLWTVSVCIGTSIDVRVGIVVPHAGSLVHPSTSWTRGLHSSLFLRGLPGTLILRNDASRHQSHPKDRKTQLVSKQTKLGFTPAVRFSSLGMCLRICFWYILESCFVP